MRTTSLWRSIVFVLMLTSVTLLSVAAQNQSGQQQSEHVDGGRREHSFGVGEFDRFHEVLHPLQHEALPQNDLARIRREARNLVLAGRPLTNIAIPAGVTNTADFCEEQADFADALKRFDRAARNGNDAALKQSYVRVHDTFEEMAHLLPRR